MKKVENNGIATSRPGGITGKGFTPGQSGNPGGRAPLAPEVREALRADTLPRYENLKRLAKKAEKEGDFKTAAFIELQLLKKQIPDLSAIELTGAEGAPIETSMRIDVRKLDVTELAALRAMQLKTTSK